MTHPLKAPPTGGQSTTKGAQGKESRAKARVHFAEYRVEIGELCVVTSAEGRGASAILGASLKEPQGSYYRCYGEWHVDRYGPHGTLSMCQSLEIAKR